MFACPNDLWLGKIPFLPSLFLCFFINSSIPKCKTYGFNLALYPKHNGLCVALNTAEETIEKLK